MRVFWYIMIGIVIGLGIGIIFHAPLASEEAPVEYEMAAVVSNQMEQYHTIGEPPELKVFQTQYDQGTQIVFDHKLHASDIGLDCIQCHHVEACSKCHIKNETNVMHVAEGKLALHENCMGCHAEMGAPTKCNECHKR